MSQAATQSPEYRKLLESYNKLRELYSNLYNILVSFMMTGVIGIGQYVSFFQEWILQILPEHARDFI